MIEYAYGGYATETKLYLNKTWEEFAETYKGKGNSNGSYPTEKDLMKTDAYLKVEQTCFKRLSDK